LAVFDIIYSIESNKYVGSKEGYRLAKCCGSSFTIGWKGVHIDIAVTDSIAEHSDLAIKQAKVRSNCEIVAISAE
jgi:hypothetical protein